MLGSPILDVAIGMVFFYLLLSLICSAVNEMLEAWLKNRSNDLELGVRRLLEDPDPHAVHFWGNLWHRMPFVAWMRGTPLPTNMPTNGLASQLYDHGLVRCLYPHEDKLPAYIPSRTFALALMDIIAPGQGSAGATQDGKAAASAEEFSNALRAANIPANVKQALIALTQAAGKDAVRIRQNLEGWYNSTMDRVSGWYKRRTQIVILCLGIVVSAALNADTLAVMQSLWNNASLRTGVANAAAAFSQGQGQAPLQVQGKDASSMLSALNLPIGWQGQDKLPKGMPDAFRLLGIHWLGWFLTAFAISLGAPFWFDLLNRFVVVRSTVKPEEKSQLEGSKD